jgi:hypothetical protein
VHWIVGFLPTAAKFAGVVAAAVVLLAVITRAFPQSLYFASPPGAFTVDFESLEYKDDGSPTVIEYKTASFERVAFRDNKLEGRSIVLSRSFPDDPLRTAAEGVLTPTRAIVDSIAHGVIDPLFYKPRRPEYLKMLVSRELTRIQNGCTPSSMWGHPMKLIREETIVGYKTTVWQFKPEDRNVRFTDWFAPQLDCASLKFTTEEALANGTFRVVSEQRALKVGGIAGTTPSSR